MMLNLQRQARSSAARLLHPRMKPQNLIISADTASPAPEASYRAIVESLPIMVCRFRPDGTLTFVNEAYCRYFRKSRAELIGRNFTPFIPEEDRAYVMAQFGSLTHANPVVIYEHRVTAPDGGIRWQRWTDRAIFEGKRLVEYLSIGEDITEQKHTADALRRSIAELQARNEELDAYAHTVAHDIKNPLALIISCAELLAKGQANLTDAEKQSLLLSLLHNADKMHNMVDELLFLAGVRHMEATFQPLDMAAIVAEAQSRLADTIRAAGAEVIHLAQWPPALGHAPWIEEVWFNYLSNALKYGGTPPRVELGARLQGNGKVRFWVQDNGVGIRPEEQANLFTPFIQLAHSSPTGWGLGLSIVRRIVEKQQGEVGVESSGLPGQGSCFYFTLPAATLPPPQGDPQ